MIHFMIGFSFLIILLIPIGYFMISLIYATGEELRKNNLQHKAYKKKHAQADEVLVPERIRVVK